MRVTTLSTIPLTHALLRIKVVVRSLLLAKSHAAAGPVSTETAWLDVLHVDVPFWLHLLAECLGKRLYGPLGRAVDTEERHAELSAHTGDVLDQATLGLVDVTHCLEAAPGDVHQAEEVDLHLLAQLLLGVGFELACQTVASVVHEDVNARESVDGLLEGRVD